MTQVVKLKRPKRALRFTTWTRTSYGVAVVAARIRKVAARIDRLDRSVRGNRTHGAPAVEMAPTRLPPL